MTLRDALAAALRDTGPDSPYLDGGEHDRQWAAAILADPALRVALTEAVAEAIAVESDEWMVTHMAMEPGEFPAADPDKFMDRAAEFVARMLP